MPSMDAVEVFDCAMCISWTQLFQELMKNSDFSAIVSYQEQAREKSLKDLLDLPYTRVSLTVWQGGGGVVSAVMRGWDSGLLIRAGRIGVIVECETEWSWNRRVLE